MNIITITLIALGLAMDSFAISIACGITIKHLKINNALKIALFFGIFHAFMLVIGWLAGLGLEDFISGVDHWVAFGILTIIGCKMIYESVRMKRKGKEFDPLNVYVLLGLSIATTIDALAVGVTFAFLEISIVTPIIVIGIVTFVLSFGGVFMGNRMGHFFENKIKCVGGLVLILIGIKILIEHLA